jgi:hypothetical protein
MLVSIASEFGSALKAVKTEMDDRVCAVSRSIPDLSPLQCEIDGIQNRLREHEKSLDVDALRKVVQSALANSIRDF